MPKGRPIKKENTPKGSDTELYYGKTKKQVLKEIKSEGTPKP